jgi:hypothetical protein
MKTTAPLLVLERFNRTSHSSHGPGPERLESRIAPAFVASLNGSEATLTGDATDETLSIINGNGTLLAHNRFTAGDPGFASDFDFDSTTPGEQTLAVGAGSTVIIDLGGGNDIFFGANGTSPLRLFGGPGNDVINGGDFGDIITGGPGNDVIDGNRGDDIIHGGDGNDSFAWDPGDNSDTIDGGAGADRLNFNGANIAELFEFSAVNGRLLLTRNIANIVMDIGTVENVTLNLLGGADVVNVNDLSSTSVQAIVLHLGAFGGAGDTAADVVTVRGSALDDNIRVGTAGEIIAVAGLSTMVQLDGVETTDTLNVSGGLGLDNVAATSGARSKLIINTDGETENSAPPHFSLSAPAGYDVGDGPESLASGNLFGSGNDLVVANAKSNSLSILFNSGDGTFAPAIQLSTGGKSPNSVLLEDFNGDGLLDIAVTNSGSGNVAVLLNHGDGTFADPVLFDAGKKPGVLRTADVNGDGNADLITITAGNQLSVLPGDGAGGFGAATNIATGGSKPVDFLFADFNGDGHLDLAVAHNGSNNVTVLTANADLTFGDPIKLRAGNKPTALATGDFDGDGLADLAVTHAASRFVSVLINSSVGSITTFNDQLKLANPGNNSPASLAVGDIDRDGRDDIIVANTAASTISVFLNAGAATFHMPFRVDLDDTPPRKTSALVLVDLNGDGRLDIAVTNAGTNDLSLIVGIPG